MGLTGVDGGPVWSGVRDIQSCRGWMVVGSGRGTGLGRGEDMRERGRGRHGGQRPETETDAEPAKGQSRAEQGRQDRVGRQAGSCKPGWAGRAGLGWAGCKWSGLVVPLKAQSLGLISPALKWSGLV